MRDRVQSKQFSLSFIRHCTIDVLYSSRKAHNFTDSVPRFRQKIHSVVYTTKKILDTLLTPDGIKKYDRFIEMATVKGDR